MYPKRSIIRDADGKDVHADSFVGDTTQPAHKAKLWEFSSLVRVAVVVAAESEAEAREAVTALCDDELIATGDIAGISDGPELCERRQMPADADPDDYAHIVLLEPEDEDEGCQCGQTLIGNCPNCGDEVGRIL